MITQFNKPTASSFAQEAKLALAALAAKHGVTLTYRGGEFSPDSFEFKFQAVVASTDGAPVGPEANAFKQLAPLYGLQASDLGRVVRLDGVDMRIVGLRPRASKRPILLERIAGPAGRRMIIGPEYVKLLLTRAA